MFGAVVALIGCHQGLRASRSAAGVGAATTSAVVNSIIAVIALDAVFAVCAHALHFSTMDAGAAISICDVDIGYAGASVQTGIRAEIKRGEIFAIVGDSGSGKSTLLKTMIGLIPPRRGEVRFGGKLLAEHMECGAPPFGVLFQNGALWTSMTVEENVKLPMELQRYSTPGDGRHSRAQAGAGRARGSRAPVPASLSGGMRKRAALARALALDPGVLFLDEPSAGLDPLTSRRLDRLVTGLRDGLGITVVLVTHELESLYSIADRMLFLDGDAHRPVALGAPAELARHAESAKVRDFLRTGLAPGAAHREAA